MLFLEARVWRAAVPGSAGSGNLFPVPCIFGHVLEPRVPSATGKHFSWDDPYCDQSVGTDDGKWNE